MFEYELKLDHEAVARARDLLDGARRIVLICHVSPDGDAVGSCLALWHVLRCKGGCEVSVVTPDCPPKTLNCLPGIRDIVVATRRGDVVRSLLANADLVVCLDFNAAMRVDRLEKELCASPAPRILIDHHLDPSVEAEVVLSYPQMSSTSALLFMVLQQMGWGCYINRNAAECIYTGMMTDTGNFSYNSNDPDIYLIIAQLVKLGVNKDRLYQQVMNTSSVSRVRICGYAEYRMDIMREHHCAVIALSNDELKEFDYVKGDTEMLVNVPLSLPDIVYSIFLREDMPGFVKVSMRSRGKFPVNKICEDWFGGGGHRNAAGGEFNGTLDMALSRTLEAIPNYDHLL